MILEVKNLSKSFGGKEILKDVSFSLDKGDILGFIGPNGAGKSTTIKCILGLNSLTKGTVLIDGHDITKEFSKAMVKVGAIVENPDLYMYLSGKQNLRLIANYYDGINGEKIEDVVKLVGLENRINDKVSKYSLGMKQRLGIAAALLNDPDLLILDEPTNGLDPEGIRDLRNLLKKLAKDKNIGILISSHNLAELESFCSSYCIIQNGKIISQATAKDLKKDDDSVYTIMLDKTRGVKKALGIEVDVVSDDEIRIHAQKEEIPDIISTLVKNDFRIYSVTEDELSLEDAFLKKTGGNKID
jgi:ABC-2 type transport system ATP-binding protein